MLRTRRQIYVQTHLLDRIGPLPYNYIPILLIEFLGYKTAAGHKLKGLLKNLKSGNDRIKDIVLRYKRTSFIIMKTVRLYSIRIVHLKITLLKYPTVKDTKKWRSIKFCSVEVCEARSDLEISHW